MQIYEGYLASPDLILIMNTRKSRRNYSPTAFCSYILYYCYTAYAMRFLIIIFEWMQQLLYNKTKRISVIIISIIRLFVLLTIIIPTRTQLWQSFQFLQSFLISFTRNTAHLRERYSYYDLSLRSSSSIQISSLSLSISSLSPASSYIFKAF